MVGYKILHGGDLNENGNFRHGKLVIHGYRILHGGDPGRIDPQPARAQPPARVDLPGL